MNPLPHNGSTVDVTVDRARTAAATEARRRAKTERLIAELVPRLPELDKVLLAALAACVIDEIERRAQRGQDPP